MTEREMAMIARAVEAVQEMGYGSVEIVIKEGFIVYIRKEVREHIQRIN